MATASPTQLYERVSEVEALSRNDHLNGEVLYQVSQEEALSRKTRGEHCERQCWYSHFAARDVCETFCTSRHELSSRRTSNLRDQKTSLTPAHGPPSIRVNVDAHSSWIDENLSGSYNLFGFYNERPVYKVSFILSTKRCKF